MEIVTSDRSRACSAVQGQPSLSRWYLGIELPQGCRCFAASPDHQTEDHLDDWFQLHIVDVDLSRGLVLPPDYLTGRQEASAVMALPRFLRPHSQPLGVARQHSLFKPGSSTGEWVGFQVITGSGRGIGLQSVIIAVSHSFA